MELSQIRYFLTLCRTKNFSKAAEELFISQPTLSQQIRRLEDELGVTLFERTTRAVKPTDTAIACQPFALQAVESLENMRTIADQMRRRASDSLSVGVLVVLPHVNVPEILSAFQREQPEIRTSLHFDWSVELLSQLQNRMLDVVISNVDKEDEATYSKMDINVCFEDRLCVVLNKSEPLASQKSVSLAEVIHKTFWVNDLRSSVTRRVKRLAKELNLEEPKFVEVQSITSLFKMLETGSGVSVMSRNVAKEYQRPGVRILPLLPESVIQTAIVTMKNNAPSSAAEQFSEFFLERIKTQ